MASAAEIVKPQLIEHDEEYVLRFHSNLLDASLDIPANITEHVIYLTTEFVGDAREIMRHPYSKMMLGMTEAPLSSPILA